MAEGDNSTLFPVGRDMAMLKLSSIGCGLGQVFHLDDPSVFYHQCLDDTDGKDKAPRATNFSEQGVLSHCQLAIVQGSA